MADEVHRRAVVGVLGELGGQLLHPVFAAAVHTGGNGLTHGVGVVHFCGGAEHVSLWVTSRGEGGDLHLAADFGDISAIDIRILLSCLDWEPEFTLKKGQRKAAPVALFASRSCGCGLQRFHGGEGGDGVLVDHLPLAIDTSTTTKLS